MRSLRVAALVAGAIAAAAAPTHAQDWSLELSAGRSVYDVLSSRVTTDNVIAGVSYSGWPAMSLFGATGIPFSGQDTLFLTGGAAARPSVPVLRRTGAVGVDLAGQAFIYRDGSVAQRGTGGAVDAFPFVRFTFHAASLEARAGWRGYTVSPEGDRQTAHTTEAAIRPALGRVIRLQGEARWVRSEGATYPFGSATLQYNGERLQLWAEAGRWFDDTLDDTGWGGGIAAALDGRTTVSARFQQEPPDPLYWNGARRTWSVGVTRLLGPPDIGALDAAGAVASSASGVRLRLPVADAPGGPVQIAGDFNNWQPAPMERDGDHWTVSLPLKPGVYHYAFRGSDGKWFVPRSSAGLRDDGMGGRSILLIVQ